MTANRQITASHTPKDLDGSGWYELLPPIAPLPVLNEVIDTDYLVIGAGFAGLNATKRLLEHDANTDVVLLEAQRLAWGACGRNSGFMIDLPHELQSSDYHSKTNAHREIAGNRLAIERAQSTADEYGFSDAFEKCGKYHGAANRTGLAALSSFASQLTALDEPHEMLDAKQMHQITGSEFYSGGLYTPGCAIIQPAKFIQSFGHGLNSHHPTLRAFENSPALSIQPGNPHIVTTPDGKIRANKIILTVNGHLASFGWFKKQLMHLFTYSSLSEPLTAIQAESLGSLPTWGLVSAHPLGTTVRKIVDQQTHQQRIVIRNTFSFNPSMKTTEKQIARFGKRHDQALSLRFAHIGKVKMPYRWGGHLCFARNSAAVFGEIEKNLFAACCHNGLGTTKGTLNGMLIADLACNQSHELLNDQLIENKPSRLPPAPIMNIAARAYLAFTQWRTGSNT